MELDQSIADSSPTDKHVRRYAQLTQAYTLKNFYFSAKKAD